MEECGRYMANENSTNNPDTNNNPIYNENQNENYGDTNGYSSEPGVNDTNVYSNDTSGYANDTNANTGDYNTGTINSSEMNNDTYNSGNVNYLVENPGLLEEVPQVPYNVVAKPLYLQTDEETEEAWRIWESRDPSIFIPALVGIIGSMLLKKVAGLIIDRALKKLYGYLFPGDAPITMLDILRAVEELVNQRIEVAVRQLVEAELEGLQRAVKSFEDDVATFESSQSPSFMEEITKVIQTEEAIRTGEELPTPTAIIDSVNRLNATFAQAIPKFRLPDWKNQSLPLYAQAANLHLFFLRDVIDNAQKWGLTTSEINRYKNDLKNYIQEYSNYCISTYKAEFDRRFQNTRFDKALEFRNFMTLNVLDYVGIWSMLRYSNVVINSSMNLYNTTCRLALPLASWNYLNAMMQGRPNKILLALGTGRLETYHPLIPGPTPGSIAIPAETSNRYFYTGTHYINGNSTGTVGLIPLPDSPGSLFTKWEKSIPAFYVTDPVRSPWIVANLTRTITSSSRERVDNESIRFSSRRGDPGTQYPDYYIRNVTGLPNRLSDPYPDIVNGFWNKKTTTAQIGVTATFNRTIISAHTNNGSIKHIVPYVADETNLAVPKPRGFTILPLQHDWAYNGDGSNNLLRFSEKFGNNGDAISIPTAAGGSKHVRFNYKIDNTGSTDVSYDVYLKVATVGAGTTNFFVAKNGTGYGKNISTATSNDGITDNGVKFKDILIYPNISIPKNTQVTLEITVSGSAAYLGQIIFVPRGVTPIY